MLPSTDVPEQEHTHAGIVSLINWTMAPDGNKYLFFFSECWLVLTDADIPTPGFRSTERWQLAPATRGGEVLAVFPGCQVKAWVSAQSPPGVPDCYNFTNMPDTHQGESERATAARHATIAESGSKGKVTPAAAALKSGWKSTNVSDCPISIKRLLLKNAKKSSVPCSVRTASSRPIPTTMGCQDIPTDRAASACPPNAILRFVI